MKSSAKYRFDPNKHNRRSIRLSGYDYTHPGAYFITICAYQRQLLFGHITDGEMILNLSGQIVQKHWQNLALHYRYVQLDSFVIMPNHFHGILVLTEQSSARSISEIIRGFKTFSSRRINQLYQAKGTPVWQRNYYEHIIRDEVALGNIRHYIQNNPRSWQMDQLHPEVDSDW